MLIVMITKIKYSRTELIEQTPSLGIVVDFKKKLQ